MKTREWIDVELPLVNETLEADTQIDWPELFNGYNKNKRILEESNYLLPHSPLEWIKYITSGKTWRKCEPLPDIAELISMKKRGDFRKIWEACMQAFNMVCELRGLTQVYGSPKGMMKFNKEDFVDPCATS